MPSALGRLEILEEDLSYIKRGETQRHLVFPNDRTTWRGDGAAAASVPWLSPLTTYCTSARSAGARRLGNPGMRPPPFCTVAEIWSAVLRLAMPTRLGAWPPFPARSAPWHAAHCPV